MHVSKAEQARRWLKNYLIENGKTPSRDVKRLGYQQTGLHDWNFVNAMSQLNGKITNAGGPTYWELDNV